MTKFSSSQAAALAALSNSDVSFYHLHCLQSSRDPTIKGLALCHWVEENWELTAPAAGQTELLDRFYSPGHTVELNKRK